MWRGEGNIVIHGASSITKDKNYVATKKSIFNRYHSLCTLYICTLLYNIRLVQYCWFVHGCHLTLLGVLPMLHPHLWMGLYSWAHHLNCDIPKCLGNHQFMWPRQILWPSPMLVTLAILLIPPMPMISLIHVISPILVTSPVLVISQILYSNFGLACDLSNYCDLTMPVTSAFLETTTDPRDLGRSWDLPLIFHLAHNRGQDLLWPPSFL